MPPAHSYVEQKDASDMELESARAALHIEEDSLDEFKLANRELQTTKDTHKTTRNKLARVLVSRLYFHVCVHVQSGDWRHVGSAL